MLEQRGKTIVILIRLFLLGIGNTGKTVHRKIYQATERRKENYWVFKKNNSVITVSALSFTNSNINFIN